MNFPLPLLIIFSAVTVIKNSKKSFFHFTGNTFSFSSIISLTSRPDCQS